MALFNDHGNRSEASRSRGSHPPLDPAWLFVAAPSRASHMCPWPASGSSHGRGRRPQTGPVRPGAPRRAARTTDATARPAPPGGRHATFGAAAGPDGRWAVSENRLRRLPARAGRRGPGAPARQASGRGEGAPRETGWGEGYLRTSSAPAVHVGDRGHSHHRPPPFALRVATCICLRLCPCGAWA